LTNANPKIFFVFLDFTLKIKKHLRVGNGAEFTGKPAVIRIWFVNPPAFGYYTRALRVGPIAQPLRRAFQLASAARRHTNALTPFRLDKNTHR
jgi:hypothetical protein